MRALPHIGDMPAPPLPDFAALPMDALADYIDGDRLPPVDKWDPAHKGRIDIRIDAQGRWFHEGGEITRPAMVRLFSRILRREADGTYVLVTPAEQYAIEVEDAPLVAVEARIEGDDDDATIAFRLNTGAMVIAGIDHPLRLRDGPAGRLPYLHVAGPLTRSIEARLARPVFYELAAHADAGSRVWSNGVGFLLSDAG